ncbi:hypothetical protein B0T09DRAFT_136675 [Sordaria sp. MPI-SDFR-AT-0083]|nr:hypothetical protein B0T09DRAFT_136675 [Sordaria sp. MPI-SDFR-AT-0083]
MYLRCIALRRIVISSSVLGLSSPHLILPSHKYQLRDPRSKIVTPFLGEHGGHCSQETRPWPRRFGIAVLRAEGSLENKVSRRNGAESTQRNEAVLDPVHQSNHWHVHLDKGGVVVRAIGLSSSSCCIMRQVFSSMVSPHQDGGHP